MMNHVTSVFVQSLLPDGQYLVTLEDGSHGLIASDNINHKGAGKRPTTFIGKTLLAERTGETYGNYPCFSCSTYELQLLSKIKNDMTHNRRNTYTGTVVYQDWKQKYILVEIEQGVTGILSAENVSMTPLTDLSRLKIDIGSHLPVAIMDMPANGSINLTSIPTFGSFEDNILALSVGSEVEGLIVGKHFTGRLVCMITPNLYTLLSKDSLYEPGAHLRLRITHIDHQMRMVEATPLEQISDDVWFDFSSYITDVSPWVDTAAFCYANRPRVKSEGVNSMNAKPPAESFPRTPHAAVPQPSAFIQHQAAAPKAIPESSAATAAPTMPKSMQTHDRTHTAPEAQAFETVNWKAISFEVLKNDTITLLPSSKAYHPSFQDAVQDSILTKSHFTVAEVVDKLGFASYDQISQWLILIEKNEAPQLATLRETLSSLLHFNVLAALQIHLANTTADTTIYFRGKNYDRVCTQHSYLSKLPFTGMEASPIKARLSLNQLLLGVAKSHGDLKHFEANVLLPGKPNGQRIRVPYQAWLPETEGIMLLESTRTANHDELLNRLRSYTARISEDFAVAITCQSRVEAFKVSTAIKSMKPTCKVLITYDEAAFAESFLHVVPAAPKTFANRLVSLLAGIC